MFDHLFPWRASGALLHRRASYTCKQGMTRLSVATSLCSGRGTYAGTASPWPTPPTLPSISRSMRARKGSHCSRPRSRPWGGLQWTITRQAGKGSRPGILVARGGGSEGRGSRWWGRREPPCSGWLGWWGQSCRAGLVEVGGGRRGRAWRVGRGRGLGGWAAAREVGLHHRRPHWPSVKPWVSSRKENKAVRLGAEIEICSSEWMGMIKRWWKYRYDTY